MTLVSGNEETSQERSEDEGGSRSAADTEVKEILREGKERFSVGTVEEFVEGGRKLGKN